MILLRLYLLMLMFDTITIIQTVHSPDYDKFLIDTPGCKIPNFKVSFTDSRAPLSCGNRQILIRKISDDKIKFLKMSHVGDCCYKNIYRTETRGWEDRKVRFTKCQPFKDETEVKHESEFIAVECYADRKMVYRDYYVLIIKKKQTKTKLEGTGHFKQPWNVILLGLDGMSRALAYHSLPRSIDYVNKEGWLDFRGYNKINESTIPNVMAVLTGHSDNLNHKRICSTNMSACNHRIVWHAFQKAGYVTAYGQESTYMPGAMKGFQVPPTDHYLRPLFLAGETNHEQLVCTGNIFSGRQVLHFILDFVNTYKHGKFFGFFWITSFAHAADQSPQPYDKLIESFFVQLDSLGVLKNTFVVLFGDHGVRFGFPRNSVESYYQDRLPMLFMHVPKAFSNNLPRLYGNLKHNQRRLITPYDIHLTLWDILTISTRTPIHLKQEGCPTSVSLLQNVSEERTCLNACIKDRWCLCQPLTEVTHHLDLGGMYSAVIVTAHLINASKTILTKRCTFCATLAVKAVLRIHTFTATGNKYYVVAIAMEPDSVTFEALVSKKSVRKKYDYKVISVIRISAYRKQDTCSQLRRNQDLCVCMNKAKCKKYVTKTKLNSTISLW